MLATLWSLMLRYKLASGLAIAAVVAMVAVTAGAAISSSQPATLSDTSTCTQWSAAPQSVRAAYAQLYVNEHGATLTGTVDAQTVETALSADCVHAAYLGESDDLNLISALEHHF